MGAMNYDTEVRKGRPVSAYPSHKFASQHRESSALTVAETGYRGGEPSYMLRDASRDARGLPNVTPGLQKPAERAFNETGSLGFGTQFRMEPVGDQSVAEDAQPYTVDPLAAINYGLSELKETAEAVQQALKEDPSTGTSLT